LNKEDNMNSENKFIIQVQYNVTSLLRLEHSTQG